MLLIFTLLIVRVVNEILTINRLKRKPKHIQRKPCTSKRCFAYIDEKDEATVQGDFFWLDKRLRRRLL